jgi:hypothetical protein
MRYHLRTLFAVVTIACLLCGWLLNDGIILVENRKPGARGTTVIAWPAMIEVVDYPNDQHGPVASVTWLAWKQVAKDIHRIDEVPLVEIKTAG